MWVMGVVSIQVSSVPSPLICLFCPSSFFLSVFSSPDKTVWQGRWTPVPWEDNLPSPVLNSAVFWPWICHTRGIIFLCDRETQLGPGSPHALQCFGKVG